MCEEHTREIVSPKKIVTIKKPEEKESDVNFGIHVISDCFERKNLKGIIIVSSDTDLTPVVRMVKDKFPDKKIIHIRMTRTGSKSIRKHSDITRKLLFKQLQNSQFPDEIKHGEITIKKPKEWQNKS